MIDLISCPYCRGTINEDYTCTDCNTRFPVNGNQPDLRVTRPVDIKTDYHYVPEFGNFPWEKLRLEWPVENDHVFNMEGWEIVEQTLIKAIPKAKTTGMYVLDLGCGINRQRMKSGFDQLGYTSIGIDIKGDAPDVLADAHRLPFKNNSFDLVFSTAVFEHLKNPFAAAAELSRVCKPGAKIMISIAYNEPFHISYFHHSPLAINELFTTAGFTTEHFMVTDIWNSFNANLEMGFAGNKMPLFMKKWINRSLKNYSLLPGKIKSIIKRDKSLYQKARLGFARSHSASVGVVANKA